MTEKGKLCMGEREKGEKLSKGEKGKTMAEKAKRKNERFIFLNGDCAIKCNYGSKLEKGSKTGQLKKMKS